MTPRDLYQVLQVDPAADAEVLEAAYRRLARKYHPDVSSAPDAQTRMRELNDAYSTLRDPVRRAGYDRGRAETRRASSAATAPQPRPATPDPAPWPSAAPQPPRPPPSARPPARGPSVARPAHAEPPRRETAAARQPRGEGAARAPLREPAPRRVRVLVAPWEELADGLLANRYLLLAAASALLLAAVLAALAARLFVPGDPFASGRGAAAEPTAAVVLVTRVPTAEPTATGRPASRSATPASWPPFIYVPVPVQAPDGATPAAEQTPAPAAPPV